MRHFFATVFFLCLCQAIVFAQEPPIISAEGLQEFCGESPMPIVTSISITNSTGGQGALNNIRIQISQGYTQGQDQLVLTGTHPNINATWSPALGELFLEGVALYSEYETALAAVVFQTTQNNFTEDKFFSINLGDANYLPSTGHYYYYIENVGISWTSAKAAAEALDYFGLQGYLATITTIEEAQLSGEQSEGTGWIGANDVTTEGTWVWVTGPEAGTAFYDQATGEAINGEFSFWNDGEPNDFNGEDYAHVTDPSVGILGSWNDLPNQGDAPGSPYHPQGFIVEFGGMPGDPTGEIQVSASTQIITPKLEQLTFGVCENPSGSTISVTSDADQIYWYETPSSTDLLYTGSDYNTVITELTTFWILQLFDGCNGGSRIPITVDFYELPEVNNIQAIQCDDDGSGDGISTFNLSSYSGDITSENLDNLTIDFFSDASFSFQINNTNYQNTVNQQIVYARVRHNETGCINSAQIELIVSDTSASNTANLEACDNDSETGFTVFNLSLADEQLFENLPPDVSSAYYLSYEDALLDTNRVPTIFTNTIAYTQTLFCRIELEGSCYGISEVYLQVEPLPETLGDETLYYCLNDFPELLTLSGGVQDNPSNYYYNWSTGETTSQIQVNEVGTYTVEVTAVDGCSKTRTITVLPSNIATINNFEITDATENNVISVFVSGEGIYEYALDDSNGPYQSSNVFENIDAGLHTIYVRDVLNNCGIVSEDVSVVGFPKFFTPNGDTYNQYWKIKGISEQFYPNSKILIFNRFGKLIREIDPLGQGWDGTLNGTLMPTDDYWFSAILQDGRAFKGHFTLKR